MRSISYTCPLPKSETPVKQYICFVGMRRVYIFYLHVSSLTRIHTLVPVECSITYGVNDVVGLPPIKSVNCIILWIHCSLKDANGGQRRASSSGFFPFMAI